jgi:protein-S-isoprenylcysteine O-methyltransferase Ste14
MGITTIGICILAFIALCILNLVFILYSSDTIKDMVIGSIIISFGEILIGVCLIFLTWFFKNYICEWLLLL